MPSYGNIVLFNDFSVKELVFALTNNIAVTFLYIHLAYTFMWIFLLARFLDVLLLAFGVCTFYNVLSVIESEALIIWPPDAKNWLIGKDPDASKDWRQEKGITEDEMFGWNHWLGHELEQTPEVGEG